MNIRTKKLAILSPVKPTYSETFIKAHIDLLPFETFHFYSLPQRGYHPIFDHKNKALFSSSKAIHFIETGLERISKDPNFGYYFRKRALRKIWKEEGIDAVMTEYGPVGAMVMEDCKMLNIPLIVHFHGRDAYHYPTINKYGKRYKQMFQIANQLIVVSLEMKAQLISLGCPAEKINVTACGPNNNFDQSSSAKEPFTFVSTGRFTPKKSPLTTIRAFNIAKQKYPNIKLLMLADGPLLGDSKQLVEQLGIQSSVNFVGPQNQDYIIELFQNAFAFVQHSVRAKDGDSEGTPVSILEAMLSELPVVSTKHAGIQDVVLQGETGFLVEENDMENMANSMIELLDNPEKAKEMGEKGKRRVLDKFTMEHHLEHVAKTIERSFI